MEITFNNKKVEHKAKFINQQVSLIESEHSERLIVVCEQEGVKTVREFVEYMSMFIGDDILITEGKDYLLSMSITTLNDMLNMLDYDGYSIPKSIQIPNFFAKILTSPDYDDYIRHFGWDRENLTKLIMDYSDTNSYCILNKDEMDELDVHDMMNHIKLSFKFVTDRYTHSIFASVADTCDSWDNIVKDAFIIPEEFIPGSVKLEMWKKMCQMSLDTYYKCIEELGSGSVAKNVLPNNVATSFYMSGTIAEYVSMLERLRQLDVKNNLTQSANMSTTMKEWMFFLSDYDYLEPLKVAMDKLVESFNEERLPF